MAPCGTWAPTSKSDYARPSVPALVPREAAGPQPAAQGPAGGRAQPCAGQAGPGAPTPTRTRQSTASPWGQASQDRSPGQRGAPQQGPPGFCGCTLGSGWPDVSLTIGSSRAHARQGLPGGRRYTPSPRKEGGGTEGPVNVPGEPLTSTTSWDHKQTAAAATSGEADILQTQVMATDKRQTRGETRREGRRAELRARGP